MYGRWTHGNRVVRCHYVEDDLVRVTGLGGMAWLTNCEHLTNQEWLSLAWRLGLTMVDDTAVVLAKACVLPL